MDKNIFKMLVLVVCFSVLFFAFLGCNVYTGTSYSEQIGWNVSEEQFTAEYYQRYKSEFDRLKKKYSLDYTEKINLEVETEKSQEYDIYFYTETYTFRFHLSNFFSSAYYDGDLYYYGANGDYGQYEDYKNLIYFLNDFTNFAAYDAKTDGCHFEELYYEAKKNYTDLYASNEIYFDKNVGSVSYYVSLQPRQAGYYYMISKNSSINRYAFYFNFEGLLKPLT